MKETNDDDLSRKLKAWTAPEAPPRLDARVLGMYESGAWKTTWWGRLMTGSVRVPIPVALAACLLFAVTLAVALRPARGVTPAAPESISAPPRPEPDVHAADAFVGFEPAKEMKVTILDRGDMR
jgi:hypothetical protein